MSQERPQQFDLFMCHNSKDKPYVEQIAQTLRRRFRLRPRLDRRGPPAGDAWRPAINRAFGACKGCAIFFGEHGRGPNHLMEAKVVLGLRGERPEFRLIPVLLPGADEARIKLYAKAHREALGDDVEEVLDELERLFHDSHRVELRRGLNDRASMGQLVSGLTGRPPGPEPMSIYTILEDAEQWGQSMGRDKAFLYRGGLLKEARQIADAQPAGAFRPGAGDLVRRFLNTCHSEERRRSRVLKGILTFTLAIIALAGVAYDQSVRAEVSAVDATMNSCEADRQRGIAEEKKAEADRLRGVAEGQRQTIFALRLATLADTMREEQPVAVQTSALLAAESIRPHHSFETDQSLRRSLDLLPRPVSEARHEEQVAVIAFAPGGQSYAAGTSSGGAVWRTGGASWPSLKTKAPCAQSPSPPTTGREVARVACEGSVGSVRLSPDGRHLGHRRRRRLRARLGLAAGRFGRADGAAPDIYPQPRREAAVPQGWGGRPALPIPAGVSRLEVGRRIQGPGDEQLTPAGRRGRRRSGEFLDKRSGAFL